MAFYIDHLIEELCSNAFDILVQSPSEEDTCFSKNSGHVCKLREINAKNIIEDVCWSSESELGTDD